MKRIVCALLVATLPFGGVLAAEPKEKNAKVTQRGTAMQAITVRGRAAGVG